MEIMYRKILQFLWDLLSFVCLKYINMKISQYKTPPRRVGCAQATDNQVIVAAVRKARSGGIHLVFWCSFVSGLLCWWLSLITPEIIVYLWSHVSVLEGFFESCRFFAWGQRSLCSSSWVCQDLSSSPARLAFEYLCICYITFFLPGVGITLS